MSGKPRIALIPDKAWWVIGEMGKQIAARFDGKYDFYFLPVGILPRRPNTFSETSSPLPMSFGFTLGLGSNRMRLFYFVTWNSAHAASYRHLLP